MVTPLERVIAERAAALAQGGAVAVVLRGSFARGTAHAYSDIDLTALAVEAGAGPPVQIEQHAGRMFVITWQTAASVRASFRDPAQLAAAVPAWRRAVALHDPSGVAASLTEDAMRWSWDPIAEVIDAYVAEGLVGLAEEVYKVVAGIALELPRQTAVNRAVLALQLPPLLGLRRRVLWDTENETHDLVADAMGEAWTAAQDTALGLDGASALRQARASLELYTRAAREIAPLLDERQRAVVRAALAVVELGVDRGD